MLSPAPMLYGFKTGNWSHARGCKTRNGAVANSDSRWGVDLGKLTYDSRLTADFEDRALAHIQLVIGAKLRRGESFYFSWVDEAHTGGGRSTIWLNPGIPLAYKYAGNRVTSFNRLWVEALSESANSPLGLQLLVEPVAK